MARIRKISLNMRVIVILLLPLHRIWKIGRVIECAGLEIRYTPFGYRGFESLIFRKHLCKVNRHIPIGRTKRNRCKTNVLQRFLCLFPQTPKLIGHHHYKEGSKEMSRDLICSKQQERSVELTLYLLEALIF